ncbi:MAG: WYL domain-containing protein [Solobacterium sp.]|nr:WYL domain-containing protein [Solobacterium sp.]
MAEKKHSVLALLDILTRYSDEEHILSAKQIQEYLSKEYNLNLERRTIYSNFNILEQDGYTISKYEDNGYGYYLESRKFEKSEVLLLCNAIHSSHFISSKQSDILIKKLLSELSLYQQKEYKDSVFMPNEQKTQNSELLYNLDTLSYAIQKKEEVAFTYLRYNQKKELEPRRKEEYYAYPRYIVYSSGRGYLIASHPKHPDTFIHYRLDRIKKLRLTDKKFSALPRSTDAYAYAKNKLFMFGGDMISVTFKCQNDIFDQMIDLFGKEIMIIPGKKDTFSFTIQTSEKGAIYLAQQYLGSLEITSPKSLRLKVKERITEALSRYK